MIYLILLLRKGKKVVNIDDDLELTGSSLILTKKFGGPTKWMFSGKEIDSAILSKN